MIQVLAVMLGYASAESSHVYIITNRLTVNLILIDSTVSYLLHVYSQYVCLNGCVNCVNSKLHMFTYFGNSYWTLRFDRMTLKYFGTEGQFSVL